MTSRSSSSSLAFLETTMLSPVTSRTKSIASEKGVRSKLTLTRRSSRATASSAAAARSREVFSSVVIQRVFSPLPSTAAFSSSSSSLSASIPPARSCSS